MAERFLNLNKKDRADALGVAAKASGRPTHLLEKDVWVVWVLRTVFTAPVGPHVVFKGGTSLSKAYNAIKRFSEDIDLTYSIRAIAPDLVGENNDEALPPSKSQEKKWSKDLKDRLSRWVVEVVHPLIERALVAEGLPATVSVDPDNSHIVRVKYEHTAEGSAYVKPVVILEFGARSTGEPSDPIDVRCDAAPFLPGVEFPVSTPRVMRIERTFWEKATAIHVYSSGGKLGGSRFSRHWYDLVQLEAGGHGVSATKTRDVADRVARHKSWFFSMKDESGAVIDYSVAVAGRLRLIPPKGRRLDDLAGDYAQMLSDGLLLDATTSFSEVVARCREIEARVNAAMTPGQRA